MVEPSTVEEYIKSGMTCQIIKVIGDGRHFDAVIVSAEFEGMSRIKRRQLVYGTLGSRMGEEIHALSMKALTPDEWEADKDKYPHVLQ